LDFSLHDATPLSLRHHRPFALYWLARVAATIALQMQAVAVGWQIYALTSSPLDLGLVGLTQFLPAILFVLVAGQAADIYDRRKLVRISQTMQGLGVATLAAATASDVIAKELILAAVFVIGGARAFEQPTMNTLLPAVVPTAMLPRAVAASSSATQTAAIVGPAIGGLLYVLGPTFVYATCCILFFSASVLIALIEIERIPPKREPLSLGVLFAGFAFIRTNPIVLGAILLDLFAVLLGGAMALLPIFARDIFAVGPWGLGILRAAPAVGALATGIVLSRAPFRRNVGRMMYVGVAAYGMATIVFGLSTSFAVSLAALAVLGASDMMSVVVRQTLVQLETPDDMRGRVSAVNSLFVVGSNQLGDFRAGVTAAWLGTIPAVLIGGIGTLLVAAVWIKGFPALFNVESYDRRR